MIRRAFRRGLTLGLLGGAVAAGAKALQGRRSPAPAGAPEWPPMADATPVTVPEPAVDVQVAPGPDPQPVRDEAPAPAPAPEPEPEPEPTVPDPLPEPVVEVHTGAEAEEHFADASRQVERPLSDWEPTAPLPPAEETTPLTPPAVPAKPKKAPAKKKAAAPAKKKAKPAAPSVEPTDGECPETHPVKGKLASKIFHVPGGFNYPRTRPDRCYVDAAAAEADGLRPAKR